MKIECIEKIMAMPKSNCICIECKERVSAELIEAILDHVSRMGIITLKDNLYERMKLSQYLHFFASLYAHKTRYQEAIQTMQLEAIQHQKIKHLNDAQKLRCAIAREIIKDEEMLFIQEPLWNLDDESIVLLLQWLESIKDKRIIMTSQSLKDICLLPGQHYSMNTAFELKDIQNIMLPGEDIKQPIKITARMKDKTLFFNPKEIDYIESLEGKNYINVDDSAFQCNDTMEELETKLKRYGFYRSHRSYLVNMQKVVEVVKWTRNSYSIKLEGSDARIPLSKGRVEDMRSIYDF